MLLELGEIGVANFTESAGLGLADLLDFLLLDFLLEAVLGLIYPNPASKFPDSLLGVGWQTEGRGARLTIKPQHRPGLQLGVDGSVQAVFVLEFDCRRDQLLLLRSGLLLATGAFTGAVLGFVPQQPLKSLVQRPDVRVADSESPGFVHHRSRGVATGQFPGTCSDGLGSGVGRCGALPPVSRVYSGGGGGRGGSL